MARIAGIDLPRNKRIEIALTYIYGIGRSTAPRDLREGGDRPDHEDGRLSRRRGGSASRDHRAGLQGRGRSPPRGLAEHQDVDGHRLLPRPAPPPRAARARAANPHQRADPQGPDEDRRRQEEACGEEVDERRKDVKKGEEEGQEERPVGHRPHPLDVQQHDDHDHRRRRERAVPGRRPEPRASRARGSPRPSPRRWPPRSAPRRRWSTASGSCRVNVKGPGSGRESAVRALQAAGIKITLIRDVTPIPHNGCRPPKRRRV